MADVERLEPTVRKNSFGKNLCNFLKLYWKSIFLVVWPIINLWVVLGPHMEEGKEGTKFKCAYIVLTMAGYWMTECVPVHITGMIPIYMFPLLQIMSSEETTMCYFKEVNMMFLGSLFLAISIEHSNLHIRIALLIILLIGADPRRLHFAILTVSFCLSMWMMNAAVAAMVCPIVKAVIIELEQLGIGSFYEASEEDEDNPRPTRPTVAYYLGITYACNLGGLGTIVGTGTNMAYKGLIEDHYSEAGSIVDFVSWLLFNLPIVFLLNCFTWFWLQILYLGMFRPKSKDGEYVKLAKEQKGVVKDTVKEKYKELGPMKWQEIWIGSLFLLAIILWFFRKPNFMPGWSEALIPDWVQRASKFIADSVPAFLIIFLLIAIPANYECCFSCSKDPSKIPKKNAPSLVPWRIFQTKITWGIIFLLGGGFAMSGGANKSGMNEYLSDKLKALKDINIYLVMCITTAFAAFVTEFASNVATCNMVLPILCFISTIMQCHPLILLHPAAVACSYAFLLPVGTPTNAISAGYANIRTVDFIKGGIIVKLAAYLAIIAAFPTYGRLFFDLEEFPSWANKTQTEARAIFERMGRLL